MALKGLRYLLKAESALNTADTLLQLKWAKHNKAVCWKKTESIGLLVLNRLFITHTQFPGVLILYVCVCVDKH